MYFALPTAVTAAGNERQEHSTALVITVCETGGKWDAEGYK